MPPGQPVGTRKASLCQQSGQPLSDWCTKCRGKSRQKCSGPSPPLEPKDLEGERVPAATSLLVSGPRVRSKTQPFIQTEALVSRRVDRLSSRRTPRASQKQRTLREMAVSKAVDQKVKEDLADLVQMMAPDAPTDSTTRSQVAAFVDTIMAPLLQQYGNSLVQAQIAADSSSRDLQQTKKQLHHAKKALGQPKLMNPQCDTKSLIGAGFTSDRNMRRAAADWQKQIQSKYPDDELKQAQVAEALYKRLGSADLTGTKLNAELAQSVAIWVNAPPRPHARTRWMGSRAKAAPAEAMPHAKWT